MTTTTDNDTGTEQGGRVSAATEKARETAHAAKAKASEAYSAARERTNAAYGAARQKASGAYETARERASSATRRTADGIDANPVGAVIGGLALGALIAAILPKTRGEQELLGDVGRRIGDTAREAARAAREAGTDKLGELGLSRDSARQKLNELASSAGEAMRSSASAAGDTIKAGTRQR